MSPAHPPREGGWLKHERSRWFQVVGIDGSQVVGLDTHDEVVVVPLNECYHPFDKKF